VIILEIVNLCRDGSTTVMGMNTTVLPQEMGISLTAILRSLKIMICECSKFRTSNHRGPSLLLAGLWKSAGLSPVLSLWMDSYFCMAWCIAEHCICWKYAEKYAAYMRHMQHICRIYAPHISPNSAYFSAYFASKTFGGKICGKICWFGEICGAYVAYFSAYFHHMQIRVMENQSWSLTGHFCTILTSLISIYSTSNCKYR